MKNWQSLIDDFTSGFNQTVKYEDNGSTQEVSSHRYCSWEYCRTTFLKYKDEFYKNGKSEKEIAEQMGVSETVVHNGLAKVLRKLRHPQISKPIHQNIVFEG